MGQSMGMLDFFVLEASEYLERLEVLAQAPAGRFELADELLRTVRALRGSALMASQQAMARGAQGLETVARALREGRLRWDERARGETLRAVDDFRILLTRARAPAPDDAARGEAMAETLERLAGRPSAAVRAAGTGLDAGARAFVAREAAAIAGALEDAARSLAADPASRDALERLPTAMSALRGVAALSDLPPLPDVLTGIEGAMKEIYASSGAVAPAVPDVFEAAARTLRRAAREVVDRGRPAAEGEEAAAFASALLRAFASPGDVVPVEQLFFDDAGPHVVRPGSPPAGLSSVEMVSLGEFLATAAADLRRAASPVIRDLRLFRVAGSLRPLASAGGSAATDALGRLADAGRSAIERGAAGDRIEGFAGALSEAAMALRGAAHGIEAALAARLEAAAGKIDSLGAAAPLPFASAPAPRPRTTRVVPQPADAGPGADLADAYAALEQLISDHGLPLGSLEELLAGRLPDEEGVIPIEALAPDEYQPTPVAAFAPPARSRPITSALAPDEEGVISIEALAPDEYQPTPVAAFAPPAGSRPITSALAPEEDVVPVESLLYRGSDALRRAIELRREIEAAAQRGDTARLTELLHEVFDLVGLGLGAAR